jgi:hypothetical protein
MRFPEEKAVSLPVAGSEAYRAVQPRPLKLNHLPAPAGLSRNAATVNSQGRKPLVTGRLTSLEPQQGDGGMAAAPSPRWGSIVYSRSQPGAHAPGY